MSNEQDLTIDFQINSKDELKENISKIHQSQYDGFEKTNWFLCQTPTAKNTELNEAFKVSKEWWLLMMLQAQMIANSNCFQLLMKSSSCKHHYNC